MKLTPKNRLAHKSSFWTRSATVSAKRDRTSAERERAKAGPTTPDQKTKRTTWESLAEKVPHGVRKRVQFS